MIPTHKHEETVVNIEASHCILHSKLLKQESTEKQFNTYVRSNCKRDKLNGIAASSLTTK